MGKLGWFMSDINRNIMKKEGVVRSLGTCMLVNHGPAQQSPKQEYKPWKWAATARYYASHTEAVLPTRKSVPRSSKQSDHTKTSWRSYRDANYSAMVTSRVHQVWPKPSCKAQWKGEEGRADRGRGGKTTSGNEKVWSLQSPRGRWKTGKNGGSWLWHHLWCPNNPRGQGIDDDDELVDTKQDYSHAKFERTLLNTIHEKANVKVFFFNQQRHQLSPLHMCKKQTTKKKKQQQQKPK